MPLLTKNITQLTRTKDLFCDWGDGIALQRDGWKIYRYGKRLAFSNIQKGPNEFFDWDAPVDPRYVHPYQNGNPAAHPVPLKRQPKQQ